MTELHERAHRERRSAHLRRWLTPGIGIKRWLLVVFAGAFILAAAGALILTQPLGADLRASPLGPLIDAATLRFLPDEWRPVLMLGIGGLFVGYGSWRLLNALLRPFAAREEPLVELIYQQRSLARGPRIVAIGGGTGQSILLRGLKTVSSNITAVVTVADDGGSSGKLRTELGIPPVGDIRNCIVALADVEPAMSRLMQYRFPADQTGTASLDGHAFGNLLIAALTAIEGDFEEGVRQSNRVLAVRGQVVPVASVPLTLHAELDSGQTVEGQSEISRARGIQRVWITPQSVTPNAEAVAAIASADLIVLGPGSLYTSLLPSLLVPQIRAALEATGAPRVYVCNVATQVGETEGYTLSDHLRALEAHGVAGLIDIVLANDNVRARAPSNYPAAPVQLDLDPQRRHPRLVTADVVDDVNAHRHDPVKLTQALLHLQDDAAQRPGLRAVRSA